MTPFGYLFVFAGALLIQRIAAGRAKDIPTDSRDFFTAFLNADSEGIGEVLQRRGENVSAASDFGEVATGGLTTGAAETSLALSNSEFANEVVKLGQNATAYRWGATGPDYYDCSGLIWRAARNVGAYTGGRFTTSTFHAASDGWAERVSSPNTGDIVLWPGKHIGIYVGSDKMYSARSVAKGIGYSTISGDTGYFGQAPEYWRVK